jgi:AraC-like DNA-binding protein
MLAYGLTKARTMGPIADAVASAGGSVQHVFARARMPLTLLDTPDQLILLRDQLTLIEAAIREIGDPALPARLSTATGIAGLGPIGVQVRSAETLGDALARMEVVTPVLLQTATRTGVRCRGAEAFYGYGVAERIESGRQANEILALGYLLGTVRHFLGPDWRPRRAVVTGAWLPARSDIEALFDCEVALGSHAGLVMSADCLATSNPRILAPDDRAELEFTAIRDELTECVAHMITLDLGDSRPSIDRVAQRLGLSRRTLQRRLAEAGTDYTDIQRRILVRRARKLLAGTELSIGRVAAELGYGDPAHFTRAFLEWTGITPSQWRRQAARRK